MALAQGHWSRARVQYLGILSQCPTEPNPDGRHGLGANQVRLELFFPSLQPGDIPAQFAFSRCGPVLVAAERAGQAHQYGRPAGTPRPAVGISNDSLVINPRLG